MLRYIVEWDDGAGERMMRTIEISVLIELDNLRLAERARAEQLFDALASEIEESGRSVEVLIGSPGDRHQQWVADLVDASPIASWTPQERVNILPVGDRRYYDIKNYLADHATGEVLVFLDGDVIPQPGWLTAVLAPLADPAVDVVCSRCIIGPLDSFYSRAVSATWIFDPRPRVGVESVRHFKANSVAFRSSCFAANRFPSNPQQYRGACTALARQLTNSGVTMVRANDAVVTHPAPNGPRAFALWHLLVGQDRASRRQHLSFTGYSRVAARSLAGGLYEALRDPIQRRRDLGLGFLGFAGAVAVGVTGCLLKLSGQVIGRLKPDALQRYL
jgi:hypothetical protein